MPFDSILPQSNQIQSQLDLKLSSMIGTLVCLCMVLPDEQATTVARAGALTQASVCRGEGEEVVSRLARTGRNHSALLESAQVIRALSW